MQSDNLIAVLVFAGLASTFGAVSFVFRSVWQRRKPVTAVQPELRRLPRLRDESESLDLVEKFDVWFERTLYLSGWSMTPVEGSLAVALIALAGGGLVFLALDSVVLTILAAIFLTILAFAGLLSATRRRLALFESQFPTALDLLARAVRAGESFDQSLTLVGEATEAPVGTELRRCAKQLELGLSVPTCMQGFAQRIGLMDTRIFANAVGVHRESGGNLPATLERLAEVIRDRQSYHRQLKSTTSAGRLSSMLITAAGPILFVYMFVFQPEYGLKLVNDPMGQWMLAFAVVTQVIGIVWVLRLLKADF